MPALKVSSPATRPSTEVVLNLSPGRAQPDGRLAQSVKRGAQGVRLVEVDHRHVRAARPTSSRSHCSHRILGGVR
jgi:hypothetical protein